MILKGYYCLENSKEKEKEEANEKRKKKYPILKIVKSMFHVVMITNYYVLINNIPNLLNLFLTKNVLTNLFVIWS